MNNPPSKQHYLPAVYLKQFSVDGSDGRRRSKIWRLDRNICQLVTVEDQCRERFYNSEAEPAKAEKLFQNYENLYAQLACKIWAGEEAGSAHNYFGLIAFMLSLHFRNPSYKNLTKDERIVVYVNLEGEFLLQILGVVVDPNHPSREHLEMFTKCWGVRLMRAIEDFLVTSDNPAQIFHQEGIPRLITLPITPQCCAVAFDRRAFASVWSQELSKQDIERLNRLQVHSCVNALFSAAQQTTEDVQMVRGVWTKRNPPPGFVSDEDWRSNYRGIEPFEFLA